MSRKTQMAHRTQKTIASKTVTSFLDVMEDGKEYGSIVDKTMPDGTDVLQEVIKAIQAIEALRERPCISYVGNVVRSDGGGSGIDATDDLPFIEMVQRVPADQRKVDVLLATRGGSGQQVARFVDCLRKRFDEVDFLIPSFCMSAGTLFALSGDRIWMTPSAALGPIDPQIPTASGRYVPAQALLLLVDNLRRQGEEALQNGQSVPWTAVRIIDTMDKKELGEAVTASQYSSTMAAQFLETFKFRNWSVRASSGQLVTPEYRTARAIEVGNALAAHDRWKSHGHSISRDVLWDEIKLKIDHPDALLQRAMTRAWAVYNWVFDKTPVIKIMVSSDYRFVRSEVTPGAGHA
jgi:hypothetical protein